MCLYLRLIAYQLTTTGGMCVYYVSLRNIYGIPGVQKPGSQYSPAIYTMDIAYNIDIPLYI